MGSDSDFAFLKNLKKKNNFQKWLNKFPYSGKFGGSETGSSNHGVDTSHIRTGIVFQMVDFGKFQNTKEWYSRRI